MYSVVHLSVTLEDVSFLKVADESVKLRVTLYRMLRILDLNCRNNGIGTLDLHLEFILQ